MQRPFILSAGADYNSLFFSDHSSDIIAGQRANWAQQNSWESFAPFAAAVIIANLCNANPERIDLYAGTFIVARVLYGIFYITDKSTLRSLVWMVGMAATYGLYYLAFTGSKI